MIGDALQDAADMGKSQFIADGHLNIEARTQDLRRTDVIIDYLGCQYVVEMKIWHGNEYNRRGGYLLSFNFNKNKKVEMKEIRCNGKTIVEVTV